LYGFLKKSGCRFIIIDEIILNRIHKIYDLDIEAISNLVGIDFIASKADYPNIVVWGTGDTAKKLVKKSLFFRDSPPNFFIDSNVSKQGSSLYDIEIKAPEALLESKYSVVVTAVQGYKDILDKIENLGLDQDIVVEKLII
jgi:FlaA1/EpsC-like NDP-sugar epimerase